MPPVTGAERELLTAAALVLMVGSLLIIPLGFPGLWIMIGVLTLATVFGEVAWWLLIFLVALAALAEVAEWVLVKETSARYGASRKAFWGAILGGLIGVFVGVPIPIVGSLIAGLIGTFVGAAAVTLWESRKLRPAGRAAWGAILGRALSAVVKTAAGVAILVLGGAALIWR